MAKDSYKTTYKTYKAGTTDLITWLVTNARRAGDKLEFLLENSSKTPTAKKPTTAGRKYQVPARQLPRLATSIANADPKIRIPQSIVTLATSVISLRKQATSIITRLSNKSRESKLSSRDDGHGYFISILEEVVSTLSPAAEWSSDTDTEKTATVSSIELSVRDWSLEETTTKENSSTSVPSNVELDNAEYELEPTGLDDILQMYVYLPLQNVHILAIFTRSHCKVDCHVHLVLPRVFDDERFEQLDIAWMAKTLIQPFCIGRLAFFKDINEIRDYIKGLWHDYRHGKLDLMSAAVTTDTAFGIMRRLSEELGRSIQNGGHWASVVGALTTYLNTLGGTTPAFSDWVFANSAHKLDSFSAVLNHDSMPVMKPGHFGIYNPKQDRSKLSDMEKEREDTIVLLELLPEFTRISRAELPMPVQDELTAGLRKMMDACNIDALPMYAVFATEVLLDIHRILREDTPRPFEEMQAVGKRVITTVDDWFRYSRGRRIVNWPPQNDEIFKNFRALAEDWTQNDMLAKVLVKTTGKPRPYWLLKNHPILCGLLTFQLNVLLQEGGMNICTSWGSMIYPAHLYNATSQSAGLDKMWADLDYLISVHSPQRIFVGSPPSDPAEYLKRFLLALGASASNFARNRRPGGRALIVQSKKGPRGLKTTSPVKDVFRDKYVYGKTNAALLSTPNLVAMLAVASKAERTSIPSVDLQSFTREMLVQKQFAPIQLLTIVREGLAAEELHLLFDYFGLHQRGCKLLRNLQTHLHDRLTNYFGQDYIEDESQLPYIIGYIFEVARGSDRIAEELRVEQENRGSRMLLTAAEVLTQFLETRDNSAKSIEQAKALSTAIRYAKREQENS